MNVMLASGLFLMLLAALYLLDIARRKGERFEYAGAMFFGELGLMFVVGQMFPSGTFGLVVTLAFGFSMLATMVVWWQLFRRFQGR